LQRPAPPNQFYCHLLFYHHLCYSLIHSSIPSSRLSRAQDIVTRYASATGHHVSRRFGWDCHGLPVEHEIDKALGIKSREDVAAMGIGAYNEECRSIVMRYSKEWEAVVHRLGRWIDFEKGYKTLDPSYMESVWWVFRQLWDKGLVYRGFKVRRGLREGSIGEVLYWIVGLVIYRRWSEREGPAPGAR
jgi:hypothetical protein